MDSVQERTTANKVIVIFVLIIIINVFTITAGIWHYTTFVNSSEGIWLATSEVEQSIQLYKFLTIMQIVLYIAGLLAFCFWLYGVYEDLPALGVTGLSYTPNWVVLSFFIPFLNLIYPFKIMTETWKASDPETKEWPKVKNSHLVLGWWFCFVLSFLLSFGAVLMFAEEQKIAKTLVVAGDVFIIFSAVFGILMVIKLEKRQDLKYQILAGHKQEETKETQTEKIRLFTPKIAVMWSFIFTPVFGSVLLIKNWRTLEKEEKAENLYIWNVAWIICFVLALLIPAEFGIKPYAFLFFFLFFVVWCFYAGKPQIQYIQKEYGENYLRKNWGGPLFLAVVGVTMAVLLNYFVGFAIESF